MTTSQSGYSEVAARVFAGDTEAVQNPLFGLGQGLLSEFARAEVDRREVEERWLQDLRQYKGQYDPQVEADIAGSKAFLRKTRIKIESVDARMTDLLFPANRERNYQVEATPEPSIPAPQKKKLVEMLTQAAGQKPDAQTIRSAVRDFAAEAARRMDNRIHDQLTEAKYRKVARNVLHSGHLYGTGILKGPLVEHRTRISYEWDDEAGRFVQRAARFSAPFLADVLLWNWYPDMSVTELDECRYVWETHRLSRAKLAELAERKTFDSAKIRSYINANPDGHIRLKWYESELRGIGDQRTLITSAKTGQYDAYERWGYLTGDELRACGLEVPDDRLHEAFFSNVWMLPDGEVIRAVLQPIEGSTWPYHMYYLDKDETNIFGSGLASIMRDDQEMINAAVRMLLDNAAQTAGAQYEVYVPAFPPNANLSDVYPNKIWPRTGGDMQYPAVRQIDVRSHMQEHLAILELFDRNADDTTGIPKYTYGDNPGKGAAGTASGLSMLMAQANMSLKDLVANWDEGITRPFISALYRWNMQFSRDDSIKGDFDVKATGVSSLMAKEIKAQALAQLGATLQPEERPFIKWDLLVEEKAKSLDLGEIVKSAEEVEQDMQSPAAQMQAQMQQMAQQLAQAEQQAKIAKLQAEANRIEAERMNKQVEAIYAAMQAAGVAAQSPAVAAGGDAILQSVGYADATPNDPVTGQMPQEQGASVGGNASPQPPQDPNAGQRAGIETAAIEVKSAQ